MPNAEYYAKHKEEYKAYRKEYYRRHLERIKRQESTSEAKARRMANYRKRLYGVDEVRFSEMLEAQRGKCLICGLEMTPPHVDHNHQTGTVRGLLCGKCNKGVGVFNDNPWLLEAAAKYVAAHASGVFTLA